MVSRRKLTLVLNQLEKVLIYISFAYISRSLYIFIYIFFFIPCPNENISVFLCEVMVLLVLWGISMSHTNTLPRFFAFCPFLLSSSSFPSSVCCISLLLSLNSTNWCKNSPENLFSFSLWNELWWLLIFLIDLDHDKTRPHGEAVCCYCAWRACSSSCLLADVSPFHCLHNSAFCTLLYRYIFLHFLEISQFVLVWNSKNWVSPLVCTLLIIFRSHHDVWLNIGYTGGGRGWGRVERRVGELLAVRVLL